MILLQMSPSAVYAKSKQQYCICLSRNVNIVKP